MPFPSLPLPKAKAIAGILFIIIIVGVAPAAAEVIPLQWSDSGSDIKPGHRYTITLSAPVRNLPFYHKYGEAAAQFGDVRVELKPDVNLLGGETYYLRIYYKGNLKKEEKVAEFGWLDSGEASVFIVVDAQCDGTVSVLYNNKPVVTFTIDRPLDVYEQEVDGGAVDVELSQNYNCGSSGGSGGSSGGDNGGDNGQGAMDRLAAAFTAGAAAAFIVVALGLAILVIVIAYSQSKKRGYL